MTLATVGQSTSAIVLVGAPAGDGVSIRAAFAPSGQCNTPSSRVGENALFVGTNILPEVTFKTIAAYRVCFTTSGVSGAWMQQAVPSLTVQAGLCSCDAM